MDLHNIFKNLLKWDNSVYDIIISDLKLYCGYHASNFSDAVKQTLNEMMRSKEIQYFTIEAGKLVITK